jgi:tRNA modification GTPase
MDLESTIVAVSSPSGNSSRALLRITGTHVFTQCQRIGIDSVPRRISTCRMQLPCGELPVLALAYESNRSFTGQETLEIELPNNPTLVRIASEACIEVTNGRYAEAGEFTARAFFNGKLSLSEAEGVCATISAGNDSELQGAALLRTGALHAHVEPISTIIFKTLALVESEIDFVDEEDVTAIEQDELINIIVDATSSLQAILNGNIAMATLQELPTVVLAGLPNAGKSSLFNVLLDRERVVVSNESGTTRDAILEPVWFGEREATIIDVAGLEKSTGPFGEQIQAKANKFIAEADVVLWCIAPGDPAPQAGENGILVHTKLDLQKERFRSSVSSTTFEGISELRHVIEQRLTHVPMPTSDALALYPRHIQYIEDAIAALGNAHDSVLVPELNATSLREVLQALGKITGTVTPDEIIGEVFSSFCIGK